MPLASDTAVLDVSRAGQSAVVVDSGEPIRTPHNPSASVEAKPSVCGPAAGLLVFARGECGGVDV
jgi:hypothetical protein